MISLKEELEQDLINQSVEVNTTKYETLAQLPLMHDPLIELCPNKDKALRLFNHQLKTLIKSKKDMEDVISICF